MRSKLAMILAVAVLAAACDDDDTEQDPIIPADAGQLADGPAQPTADGGVQPGADAAGPTAVTVSMQNNQFLPMNITVRVGQTIHWVNDDAELHTVTSGTSSQLADMPGQLFDSQVAAGGSFDYTPNAVGNIPYFCRIHELIMKGTITVTP